ncbi:MAG: hypothetical protein IJF88_05560 [Oscillospiraceae bacterium]|nr:hypothetical protein [Oscillospiraceae bacterium]
MNKKTVRRVQAGFRALCGLGALILLGSVGACDCGSIGIKQCLIQAGAGFAACVIGAMLGGLVGSSREKRVREEVSCIMGRDVSDHTWVEMYARAQKKLRCIITRYGDANGARRTIGYLAQLTVEAIQDQDFTDSLEA